MGLIKHPEPYVAGLFDGGGNVYFRISKSNRELGYRINPTIIIHINQNNELYGFLDEFFVENQIQFKVSSTDDGARRIEIDTKNNVSRFLNLIKDHTIQHSFSCQFILNHFFPTRESGNILKKKNFIQMVRSIETLQPRRASNESVKYTTEYFREKWGVDENITPVMIPRRHDRQEVNDGYVAGFFDGAGKIRPVIHKSGSIDLGYSISLRVGITRSWLRDRTINALTNHLNSTKVEYNINEQGSRISIHVTEHDSIREFLNNIQTSLISNFEISMLTVEKILPAFEDNYHRTKQGLHDIVSLYEIVMDKNPDRKYTSEYFRRQWNKVQPLEAQNST